MWTIIQELKKMKSFSKKADQLEFFEELASRLESIEYNLHDGCCSPDQIEEARDELREELQSRIDQLEEALSKGRIAFPSRLRSDAEKRKFKVIPGGF